MARRKPKSDHPLRDASRGIRLHKALAEAGVASRRACEKLVEEGRVSVNGETITTLPAWVDPETDRLEVDGRVVRRKTRARTYLMVHKPKGVICTNDDPQGRRCIFDLVPVDQRLFCVGRLDHDSTGLVLLTDDGDLAHRLMHPSHGVSKTYRVSIQGVLEAAELEKLRRGVWLADRRKADGAVRAAAETVRVEQKDRDKTRLMIELREGRNREIRRMLARVGQRVKRLERVALGPLRLKGLARGQWRRLTPGELAALRRAAKPR